MSIVLVGLNHRTASVELREKIASTNPSLHTTIQRLQSNGLIQESVVLSTCNRLEIYAVVSDVEFAWRAIESSIAQQLSMPSGGIKNTLYFQEGRGAVQHLMQVTSGLDSMILGEPQILGQAAQAFEEAHEANMSGPILSHLFAQAVHAGKRARSDTEISRHTTSVSHAGAQLVIEQLGSVEPANALIVGTGEMSVLAAQALQQRGVKNFAFINRTYHHAEQLAVEYDGIAMNWSQLGDALRWADVAVTATAAPHTIIHREEVEVQFSQRPERPLIFVDIALPRDVHVNVGEIPGVLRFDIDDLQSIVDGNRTQREAAIPMVKTIIEDEINTYFGWYHSYEISPVIKNLRSWANEIAQAEVDQALNKLTDADERTVQIVNRLAHRLVNKLLHNPTIQLRDQAAEGNGFHYANTVSELFGLIETQIIQHEVGAAD